MSLASTELKWRERCLKSAELLERCKKKLRANSEEDHHVTHDQQLHEISQALHHAVADPGLDQSRITLQSNNELLVLRKLIYELDELIEIFQGILTNLEKKLEQLTQSKYEKNLCFSEQQSIDSHIKSQLESKPTSRFLPNEEFAQECKRKYIGRSKQITVELEMVTSSMFEFCDKYFPSKNKFHEYLPLSDIIEKLVACKNPQEFYVDNVKEYWPPHIEMLLRFDILKTHPEDSSKLVLCCDGL